MKHIYPNDYPPNNGNYFTIPSGYTLCGINPIPWVQSLGDEVNFFSYYRHYIDGGLCPVCASIRRTHGQTYCQRI